MEEKRELLRQLDEAIARIESTKEARTGPEALVSDGVEDEDQSSDTDQALGREADDRPKM